MIFCRQNECYMLLLAGFIGILGIICVNLALKSIAYLPIIMMMAITLLWVIVSASLYRNNKPADIVLLPLVALLTSIGLIEVWRLQPKLFIYQAVWVIVGIIAFYLSARWLGRNMERLSSYTYSIGLVGIILLLSTIIFGIDIGGNKNWIILGPLRFQPSEFAKLFIVMFFAGYLSDKREVLSYAVAKVGPLVLPPLRFVAPLLVIWGIAMMILVLQRDLGAALLFYMTSLLMIYIASGRLNYFVFGIVLFTLGAILCYFLFSHVRIRIDIWLNPWSDPNGKAYQIVQSLFALGSGGILGSGLGYGAPEFIPAVHTDFVFAAIGEELGLTGTVATLTLYVLLIYRFFKKAILIKAPYSKLVISGFAAFFSLQVFLIIGGVTNFVPLTGITLPFISYGGSSIVSNYIMIGMVYAMSEMRPTHAR